MSEKVHKNACPILNGKGAMAVCISIVNVNNEKQITA
jgi:hypothetical protein